LEALTPILLTVITAATPLLLAATGELVAERAGVLNLGVEGMMLAGAVAGFATVLATGSHAVGITAAAAAGAAMALVFALLTLSLLANQVATGLALSIFGIGLTALVGAPLVGQPVPRLEPLALPWLSALPVLGPVLFGQNILVYLSLVALLGVAWFLARTRSGLILRACGENQEAAHALGHRVIGVRYLAVLFGGAMAGLGGAFLSLAYTPLWIEEMTAGRGWIALALVVFAAWRPGRLLLGAYLFGAVAILQLYVQGAGLLRVPAEVLSMLPYLATIAVLVVINAVPAATRLGAPASLAKPFRAAA
jgi:general nucleoside transport system permease protein